MPNNSNKVSAYFRYGIDQKLRFYPEMLVSLIPRFFIKPSDVSAANFADKIYSNDYKHGWSIDLTDDIFDEYYKKITGVTHISNNYNRQLLDTHYSCVKDILCFRDLLEQEICMQINSSNIHILSIRNINQYLLQEEYDSETIIYDILLKSNDENSNIEKHLLSNSLEQYFNVITNMVEKYTNPVVKNKIKLCSLSNVYDVNECEDIAYILTVLKLFQNDGFQIDVQKYDVSLLMGSWDHLINTHKIKSNTEEKISHSNDIITYITTKIGYCKLSDKCCALKTHKTRKREVNRNENNSIETQDTIKEIISATLCSLHYYLQHSHPSLIRLEQPNAATHFITTNQNDEHNNSKQQKNCSYNIEFGVSVLQWLKYSEKHTFRSLKEEIINNAKSTINEKMYLSFVQECFIKMINRKSDQYTLDELLSVKLYTDTNSFQSSLRKSFWKSTTLATKKSFYQWAMRLHKAALFHARPIPPFSNKNKSRPQQIFHGLNTVLVLEDALCKYHGPISTTTERTVANTFSENRGLIWEVQASYDNKFRFVEAIEMDWISQHKNEQEVLLINQYLPIVKAINFVNDLENDVNHLLYSLKSHKEPITNANRFFKTNGLYRIDYKHKRVNVDFDSKIEDPVVGQNALIKGFTYSNKYNDKLATIIKDSNNGKNNKWMVKIEMNSKMDGKKERKFLQVKRENLSLLKVDPLKFKPQKGDKVRTKHGLYGIVRLCKNDNIELELESNNNEKIEVQLDDLIENHGQWIPLIMSNKQFLYAETEIQSKTLLERLWDELQIKIFRKEYKVLSAKFNVEIYPAFSYYSLQLARIPEINDVEYVQSKVVANKEEKNAEEFDYKYSGILYKKQTISALCSITTTNTYDEIL
eukprot:262828_1